MFANMTQLCCPHTPRYILSSVCLVPRAPRAVSVVKNEETDTNMATFSALAKLAAKCRRKCLLESQFESLSINCKRNNLLLRNYLKPGVCFIRHFALKSFPWTQSTTGMRLLSFKKAAFLPIGLFFGRMNFRKN